MDNENTGPVCRILLVEDHPAAAIAARLQLERFRCAVDVAHTGRQALDTISDSDAYDLVLLDVGLPDMSGVEVTQAIRGLSDTAKAEVPIIALTGHADADKHQQYLDVGMSDVLIKPATPPRLHAVLQRWIFQSSKTSVLSSIDWDSTLRACQNNEAGACDLLSMLYDDLKKTKEKIAIAYAEQDYKTLEAELHRCLGGVVYLRLPELEEALRTFHAKLNASKKNNFNTLEENYQALMCAIDRFMKDWNRHDGFSVIGE